MRPIIRQIRSERCRQKLTVAKAARIAGVGASVWWRMEQNGSANSTTVEKAAAGLGRKLVLAPETAAERV